MRVTRTQGPNGIHWRGWWTVAKFTAAAAAMTAAVTFGGASIMRATQQKPHVQQTVQYERPDTRQAPIQPQYDLRKDGPPQACGALHERPEDGVYLRLGSFTTHDALQRACERARRDGLQPQVVPVRTASATAGRVLTQYDPERLPAILGNDADLWLEIYRDGRRIPIRMASEEGGWKAYHLRGVRDWDLTEQVAERIAQQHARPQERERFHAFVLALLQEENHGYLDRASSAGAQGVGQVMPREAARIALRRAGAQDKELTDLLVPTYTVLLRNPWINAEYAGPLMQEAWDYANGNPEKAAQIYNGGLSNFSKGRIYPEMRKHGQKVRNAYVKFYGQLNDS